MGREADAFAGVAGVAWTEGRPSDAEAYEWAQSRRFPNPRQRAPRAESPHAGAKTQDQGAVLTSRTAPFPRSGAPFWMGDSP